MYKYLFKIIIFTISVLSGTTLFGQSVVINEVMANSGQSEGYNDAFVELRGPAGTDIGCWVITNGEWAVRFPAGTSIPANEHFVIGCSEQTGVSGLGTTGDYPNGPTTGISCDICDFAGLPLDFDVCDPANGAFYDPSGVGFNLAPDEGFVNNGDQLVLFDETGDALDGAKWGGGNGAILTLSPYTLGTTGGVPVVPGPACPAANFTMPVLSNLLYVNIGGLPQDCNTNFYRNHAQASDGILSVINPSGAAQQWDFSQHPSPGALNSSLSHQLLISQSGGPFTAVTNSDYILCNPADLTFHMEVYNYQNVQPNIQDLSGNAGSWIFNPIIEDFESWIILQDGTADGTTIFEYQLPASAISTFGNYSFLFQWDDYTNEEGSGNLPGSILYNNCYEREIIRIVYVEPMSAPSDLSCPDDLPAGTINLNPFVSGGFNKTFSLSDATGVLLSNQSGIFSLNSNTTPPLQVTITDEGGCSGPFIIDISEDCQSAPICPEDLSFTLTDPSDGVLCFSDEFTLCASGIDLPSNGSVAFYYNSQASSDTTGIIYLGETSIPTVATPPIEDVFFVWDNDSLSCPGIEANNAVPPPNGNVSDPSFGTTFPPTRGTNNVNYFGTFCSGNDVLCGDDGQDRIMNSNTWSATSQTEAIVQDMYYEFCLTAGDLCDQVVTNIDFDISHSSGGPTNIMLTQNADFGGAIETGTFLGEACINQSYATSINLIAGTTECFRIYAWKSDGTPTNTGTLRIDDFTVTTTPLCSSGSAGFTGDLDCITASFPNDANLCDLSQDFQFWAILRPFGENCPEGGSDLTSNIEGPLEFEVLCPQAEFLATDLELCETSLPSSLPFSVTGGLGNIYQIAYAINGDPSQGSTQIATGGGGSLPINSVTNDIVEYSIYEVSNGTCFNTLPDPVTTTVNVLTSPSVAFGDVTFGGCGDNSTIAVNFSPNGSGPWSLTYTVDEQPITTVAFETPFTLNAPQDGDYQIVSVNNSDCDGTIDMTTLTVANPANPTLANIPDENYFIAPGEAITLTLEDFEPIVTGGEAGGFYVWFAVNPNDPSFNPALHIVQDEALTTGTQSILEESQVLYALYVDPNGCQAVADFNITIVVSADCVDPVAGEPFPPTNTTFCVGEEVDAASGNGAQGGEGIDDYIFVVVDPTGQIVSFTELGNFTPTITGVHQVYGLGHDAPAGTFPIASVNTLSELEQALIDEGYCFDISTVFYEITVNAGGNAVVTVDDSNPTFCPEGNLALSDFVIDAQGGDVSWSTTDALTFVNDSTISLDGLTDNVYTLTASIDGDCGTASDDFTFEIINLFLDIQLDDSLGTTCMSVVTLNPQNLPNSSAFTFEWSGPSITDPTDVTPTVNPDGTYVFTLSLTNNPSCSISDSIFIFIDNSDFDCDDGCALTTDSFDDANCMCVNTPIAVDDGCPLTIDSVNVALCMEVNVVPDCNDNDPDTQDSFNLTNCECVNVPDIIFGCTNPCAPNFNPMANQDDGSCNLPNCDDGCPLTQDVFDSGICDCINFDPVVDDNCALTIDSFDTLNCVIVNTPIGLDDNCPLTLDTLINCTIVHMAPDTDDGCPLTLDIFDIPNCMIVNTPTGIDDNCALTTDTLINCMVVNIPPNLDDNCPITTDTLINCMIMNIPNCDDNDINTTDTFDAVNCECIFTQIPIDCTPIDAALSSNNIGICQTELPYNLSDLVTATTGGAWLNNGSFVPGAFYNTTDFNTNTTLLYIVSPPATDPVECTADTAVLNITVLPTPDAGNDGTGVVCNTGLGAATLLDLNTLLTTTETGTWASLDTGSPTFIDANTIDGVGSVENDVFQYAFVVAGQNCPNDTAFFDILVSACTVPCTTLDASLAQPGIVCSANEMLDLTQYVVGDTGGVWTLNNVLIDPPFFDLSVAGNFQLVYTVSPPAADPAACQDVFEILDLDILAGGFAGPNQILDLCYDNVNLESEDLNALLDVDPTTGTWISLNTATPPLAPNGVVNVSFLSSDVLLEYGFVVEGDINCNSDTAFYFINAISCSTLCSPIDASVIATTALCLGGDSVSLTNYLLGDLNGTWFLNNATVTDFEPTTLGDYEFTYVVQPPATDSAFCLPDTALMQLSVTDDIVIPTMDSVCVNEMGTYDLGTYLLITEWFFDDQLNVPIPLADWDITPGVYYGTDPNNSCISEPLELLVFPIPNAPTIVQNSLCEDTINLALYNFDLWFNDSTMTDLITDLVVGSGTYYPVVQGPTGCNSPVGTSLTLFSDLIITPIGTIECLGLIEYEAQIVVAGGSGSYQFSGDAVSNQAGNPTSAVEGDTLTFTFDDTANSYQLQTNDDNCNDVSLFTFNLPNCACPLTVDDASYLEDTICYNTIIDASDLSFNAVLNGGAGTDYAYTFVLVEPAIGLIYDDATDGEIIFQNPPGLPLPPGDYCIHAIGYFEEDSLDLSGGILNDITNADGLTIADDACISISPCFTIHHLGIENADPLNPLCLPEGTTSFDLTTIGEIDLWYSNNSGTDAIGNLTLNILGDTTVYGTSLNAFGCESLPTELDLNLNPMAPTLDNFCIDTSVVNVLDLGDYGEITLWFSDPLGNDTISPTDYQITVDSDSIFYGVAQNAAGCFSEITNLNVVLQAAAPNLSQTIACTDDDSEFDLGTFGTDLLWFTDGTLMTAVTDLIVNAGTYYTTSIGGSCAGSSDTLIVIDPPTFSQISINCTDDTTYVLGFTLLNDNGFDYTLTGTAVDAGNPNTYTSGDNLSFTLSSLTPTYELILEPIGGMGCPDTIAINSPNCNCPETVLAAPTAPLCAVFDSLALVDLMLPTTGLGTWSITGTPTGPITPIPLDGFFVTDVASQGTYELTFTLNNLPFPGCPDNATVEVNVLDGGFAGVADFGNPVRCQNSDEAVDLFGLITGETLNGTWVEITDTLSINNAFDPIAGTFIPLNQEVNTYQFQYITVGNAACADDTSEIAVQVVAFEELMLTELVTACNDEGTTTVNFDELVLAGSIFGDWTDDNGSGAALTSVGPTIYDFSGVVNGDYLFTYEVTNDNACPIQMGMVLVTVENCDPCINPPTPVLSPSSLVICFGEMNQESVTTALSEIWTYEWSLNGVVVDTTNSFTPTTAGNYEVTATIDSITNCESLEPAILVVEESPFFEVSTTVADSLIEAGVATQIMTLVSPQGTYTYNWNEQISGLNDYDTANPTARPFETTIYQLMVTDEFGCSILDTAIVNVIPEPFLLVPNAFTPNFDGTNDYFYPIHSKVTSIDWKVFDRWGEMLYETNDLNAQGWDGTNDGEPAAMGVYLYQISYQYDGEDKIRIERGDVTLVR